MLFTKIVKALLGLLLTWTVDNNTSTVLVGALQQPLPYHHDSYRSSVKSSNINSPIAASTSRRLWIEQQMKITTTILVGTSSSVALQQPIVAYAGEFAPGGTLITDKEIGIYVNNPNACPLRQRDNSNVLFDKDYYYKFGTGIQFITPPGNTAFPKTMPFTKTQQRYDSLKKYRERIVSGLQLLQSLPSTTSIADPKSKEDVYQLRAMGLLANGLLASENNGIPNEVFVARYYINEIYLRVEELLRSPTTTGDSQQQQQIYDCIEKATNSYLTLMNRVITSKVGEPFPYIYMTTSK